MKKKRLIAILLSSTLFFQTPNANACCGVDGGIAAAATLEAQFFLGGVIMEAEYAIVAAIEIFQDVVVGLAEAMAYLENESTAAIVAAIEGSMKVNAFAQADALNAHKQVILLGMAASDKLRISAEQSLATLPQANVTGAAASVAGQAIEGSTKVSSYANTALANRHLTTKNTLGSTIDSYQVYLKNYGPSSEIPDADMLADSLLAGAGKSGNVTAFTYNPKQIRAAQDFINNAVDIAPPNDIPDSAANTIEGRRFRSMLRAEKARMSLAFKSFADALAYRTPIPGFAVGKDIGLPGLTGDISYQEFLTNEVRRRYNNPAWYSQVAGATPANLQREGLYMQALELHMRMEDAKRMEKIELLLAQLNMNSAIASTYRKEIETQRTRVVSTK